MHCLRAQCRSAVTVHCMSAYVCAVVGMQACGVVGGEHDKLMHTRRRERVAKAVRTSDEQVRETAPPMARHAAAAHPQTLRRPLRTQPTNTHQQRSSTLLFHTHSTHRDTHSSQQVSAEFCVVFFFCARRCARRFVGAIARHSGESVAASALTAWPRPSWRACGRRWWGVPAPCKAQRGRCVRGRGTRWQWQRR